MAIAVMPLRIGDTELLVEVVQVAGSEPTARRNNAGRRATEAFESAREAIVALVDSATRLTGELADRSIATESLQLEFGLKFSTQGNVIIASGSAEAALTIRFTLPGAAGRPDGRPPTAQALPGA